MRRYVLQEHPHRRGTIGPTPAQGGVSEATQDGTACATQAPGLGVNLGKQIVGH
jgi:hypothetical protein